MLPQWSNHKSSRRNGIRTPWLRLHIQRVTLPLGQARYLTPVCARTRTSVKDTAIGGAVRPLPEPHPSKSKKWMSAVTLSLPNNNSVSASAYEDGSGEGSFSWQKGSSRVLRKHVRVKRKRSGSGTASHHKTPDLEMIRNLGLLAGRNYKFSLQKCLKGLTLSNRLSPTKPISAMFRRKKSKTALRYDRRARFEVRRNSSQHAMMFSLDDSEYGHVKLSFAPRKRLAASFRLIQSTDKRISSSKTNQSVPNRKGSSSRKRTPSLQSDVEYDWKRDSYVLLHRVETSRRAAQLRIATNPFRVTPRLQIPLGGKENSRLYISWTREPKSGVGEFEFGWKGTQFSAGLKHPKFSIRRKTSDGGYSAISLNNKRLMKLDQNLVSKPVCGVAFSLNSCMTNQKDITGASLTATAPWGSVAAHVRTSMACGFSVISTVKRKKRSIRLKVAMENLKTASFRIGIFY